MKRVLSSLIIAVLLGASAQAAVPSKVDVLIVGAGLSGLATAYELRKAGISYHILELTPHIGGRVRTVKYKINGEELTADSGMEEYWESNPAVKLFEELKLPTRHDEAVSSIVINKKVYEFGDVSNEEYFQKLFTAREIKSLTAFKEKVAKMLPDLNKRPIPAEMMKLKDQSFAAWVEKQKLSSKVSEWIRISIECEVGTEWTKLPALDGIAEFHIFTGKGEQSYRIIDGNEKFTEALTGVIGRNHITTNHRVTKIKTEGSTVSVSYLDQATNYHGTLKASHVVTTVPLFRLAMEVQFEPGLSEVKLKAINSQTYGSYFKAHVFAPEIASKFWKIGDASLLPLLSDSELGVVYEGNPDQETKMKIISLLITGSRAEAFNFMNQDQTRAMITAAFERLWPGFSKHITGMEFYRYHPRAIAGWPVGRSRYDELSEAIRKPENRVYLAGDFTEGTHSSGAFVSAFRVVDQIKKVEKK